MAYTPLTPVKKTAIPGSIVPATYTPLLRQGEDYFQSLIEEVETKIANIRDYSIEDTQESDIKDIWDAFWLGGINMAQKSKAFILDNLPKMIFKDIKAGDKKAVGIQTPTGIARQTYTKEEAQKINERNTIIKGLFKKANDFNERKYQEYIAKHPQLQPRKEWVERGVIENIKENPKIFSDPAYWGYIAADSAAFTVGVMGTTLGVAFLTKNPLLGITAGVAVATPSQTRDLYEDLIANGASEEQALSLSKYIGPVIASVEVMGDFPILRALGGKVFANILGRNIRSAVAGKVVSGMAKKGLLKAGLVTFTQIEVAETLEEILQGVIQDATVKTVNQNRSILKNIPETTLRTLMATLPFAIIGGSSAIRQEARKSIPPAQEITLEEKPTEEITMKVPRPPVVPIGEAPEGPIEVAPAPPVIPPIKVEEAEEVEEGREVTLEPLTEIAKQVGTFKEFSEKFINTFDYNFQNKIATTAEKPTYTERFSEILKEAFEEKAKYFPPAWTGKVLTELTGSKNLETALNKIERQGKAAFKKESPSLKTFYNQAVKGVEEIKPEEIVKEKPEEIIKEEIRGKTTTGERLRTWWEGEGSIIFEGKEYSVKKMSYGDYFIEPVEWKGGETEGFAPGTRFLEKVDIEKDIYEVGEVIEIEEKPEVAKIPLTKPEEVAKVKVYEPTKPIPEEGVPGVRPEVRPEELPGALPVGEERPEIIGREVEEVGRRGVSRKRGISRPSAGERSRTLTVNAQIEALVLEKGNDSTKYTDEEKALLKKYTGAGGLETEGANGRGLLDEYYTPKPVVDYVWDLVGEQIDFKKFALDILEPSIGIGSFIFDTKQAGFITGYEINKISADIAQVLMPGAQINNAPFESIFIDDRGNEKKWEPIYDLVIGNPPYGEHRGIYKGLGEEKHIAKYEYYFLKRSLDVTKDGGVVAMVVPSSILRGPTSDIKDELSQRGELVEARRLPNGTFAHTDIGTDILVFKKSFAKDPIQIEERSRLLSDDAYFNENPEKIIGEEKDRIGKFGPEKYVEGSLPGMEDLVAEHEPEIEVPNEGKIVDAKDENINIPDGEVDLGNGMAEMTEEEKAEVNQRIVIVSDKKEKTIQFKKPDISAEEEELWNKVLATGELSPDVKTGILVNYNNGKWYNDFNYTQGNIYEKLDQLEKDKETISPEQYTKQKGLLNNVLPTFKKIEDIILTPNSDFAKEQIKWGEDSLVDKFMKYIMDLPSEAFKNSDSWEVRGYIDGYIVNSGDKKFNAEIRRRRRQVGNELFKRFYTEELTADEKKEVEKQFNRTYNAIYLPDYRTVPMTATYNSTFKGLPLTPHPHQYQGVGFLVNKGVGTLAWDVGWGKTMATIMSLNEMMNKGWTKRPIIIVPNGVYYNWIRELKEIVPNVKINSLTNLGGKFRGNLGSLEIPEGTISVITYDGMKKLGFKPETYQRLLVDLQDVMSKFNTTKRSEAKDKEKVAEAIGRAARKTSGERFFEDLGFDFAVIDEIHNFKNIFAGAKLEGRGNEFRNVRGSSSDRGIKAYVLAQYILGQNNGRGVIGLSATPFTNSPMEIYSIISLFARRRLEELKIKNVNDFMNMFMRLDPRFQVKADRTVRDEDVIESFYNLQQLQKLIGEYIDFRSGETVGFVRPEKDKRTIVLKPTETQMRYLDMAQSLFEDKDAGGAIVAITEQQNITLSPYLSRYSTRGFPKYREFVENSPKIKQALEAVRQIKKDRPEVGQVIYMSRGIDFFPLIKEYLTKEIRYKPNQVGIISGGMSIDAKQQIQDDFNAGKIKVLIGSEAIKEGVNLQKNTTELHHLHLPWNPTDLLQIEGRIWRQNNDWLNVRVHYYLIENSIDQFIFQKLETKEKRIKNIWSYTGDEIEVGDLNFEEMKLDLITDPLVKARAEKVFALAKEKREIETIAAEAAFLGRKIQTIINLDETIEELTEKTSDKRIKELKEANYTPDEIVEMIKDTKKRKSRLQRELVVARRNLRGVDEAAIKSEVAKMKAEVEKRQGALDKLSDEHDKKIKKAEGQVLERIIEPNNYTKYVSQLAEEDKTFFVKRKVEKPKFVGKGVTRGAAMGVFREDYEVELGGLDQVKPVEFIELVSLARELSGKFPIVKKLPKSLGITKGLKIALNRDLFEAGRHKDLALVLGHELGHLIDFLPDYTSSRGNLIGRLKVLRTYMKDTFGDMEVTNKELRKELIEVSEWWRPYDKEASSESFVKYRNSAVELYADAISVLFNTPGTLEKMAPNFYHEFFANLDLKPDVKSNFFDLQELLAEGEEAIISKRDKEIRQMFQKGEDLFKIKEEEKKNRQKSLWFTIRHQLIDRNQALIDLIEKTKKAGEHINDDENPIYFLEEHNYLGGKIKQFIEKKVEPVRKNLEDNKISWEDFGVVLFLNRVIKERGALANPLGWTPETAEKQLAVMRSKMGEEVFKVIDKNVESYREAIKDIMQEGYDSGLYKQELYQQIIDNPAYATFQVLDHLQTYIPASIKHQIGTLKEISNPATATIIKTISIIRAIERNKIRKSVKGFLTEFHPTEIKPAKKMFDGKRMVPIESEEANEKLVTYMDNGNIEGIYVDPYIADSLTKNTIGQNRGVIGVIRLMNKRVFRPLFITYNPGFQLFNLMRDFVRAYKNIPGMSLFNLVKLYGKSFKAARARAWGQPDEVIAEMEKSQILSVTYNDIIKGREKIDEQIDMMMAHYGIIEPKVTHKNPVLKYIMPVLDFLEHTGNLIETLPKVAGYKYLNGKLPPHEFGSFIRTRVGSPDFLRRGEGYGWYNELFLFSNAIKEGMRADYASAFRDPKTRSGFWFKTTKLVFLPKLLMFAVLLGLFGDDAKEIMEGATEYDKTNYIIIPLGKDENGKSIYFRVPQDETGRIIGGIFWKALNIPVNGVKLTDVFDLTSYLGGQIPSPSPIITAAIAASQYAGGQNPYDFFRGREVLTDKEFEAGGKYSLIPFLKWGFQQLGGGTFMRFEIHEQTPTEKTLLQIGLNAPIINNIIGRFIRNTDYGVTERAKEITKEVKGERAAERIEEDKIINKYVKKFQSAGSDKEDIIPLMIDATKEAFKGQIKTKSEVSAFQKKFKVALVRGHSDSRVNALIYAISIDAQMALLKEYKENMGKDEFNDLFKFVQEQKIISQMTASKFFNLYK